MSCFVRWTESFECPLATLSVAVATSHASAESPFAVAASPTTPVSMIQVKANLQTVSSDWGTDSDRRHIRQVLSGDAWDALVDEEHKLNSTSEENLMNAISQFAPEEMVRV